MNGGWMSEWMKDMGLYWSSKEHKTFEFQYIRETGVLLCQIKVSLKSLIKTRVRIKSERMIHEQHWKNVNEIFKQVTQIS